MYSDWSPSAPVPLANENLEMEFYDYSTTAGRLELANTPLSAAANASRLLLNQLLLQGASQWHVFVNKASSLELQAPLPTEYHATQLEALAKYWATILLD